MTDIQSLQSILDTLYTDMMPLCSKLILVARMIGGFAALWYIASRVWRHLANAEAIDFYPLLRPFALGFCIIVFPYVIALMNGILRPTVAGTAAMVSGSNAAIEQLLKLKEEAIKKTPLWGVFVGPGGEGNRDEWYRYTHPGSTEDEGLIDGIGNDIRFEMAKASYNFRNSIKAWLSEVLQLIYQAAALCINTLRTFFLIVLAIIGPIVFGFAIFDGFQNSLTNYLARYISVFLWLPVANIFGAIIGKIQENMLRIDLDQVYATGDTFFSATDTAYLIFLVIGIIGYFTVPSVASYIVSAGGSPTIVHKVNTIVSSSASSVLSTATKTGSAIRSTVFRSASPNTFQHDKLSGKKDV